MIIRPELLHPVFRHWKTFHARVNLKKYRAGKNRHIEENLFKLHKYIANKETVYEH